MEGLVGCYFISCWLPIVAAAVTELLHFGFQLECLQIRWNNQC
jgi:hypothetical protein